jgi:hypothetical protein
MTTLTNVFDAAVAVDIVDVAVAHAPSPRYSDFDKCNPHYALTRCVEELLHIETHNFGMIVVDKSPPRACDFKVYTSGN